MEISHNFISSFTGSPVTQIRSNITTLSLLFVKIEYEDLVELLINMPSLLHLKLRVYMGMDAQAELRIELGKGKFTGSAKRDHEEEESETEGQVEDNADEELETEAQDEEEEEGPLNPMPLFFPSDVADPPTAPVPFKLRSLQVYLLHEDPFPIHWLLRNSQTSLKFLDANFRQFDYLDKLRTSLTSVGSSLEGLILHSDPEFDG